MGTKYDFTCKNCRYRTEASGGRDCGMVAVVQTCICRSCCQLIDVLSGRNGVDGPTGDLEYDKKLGICPSCKSTDVVTWEEPWPCPKCGKKMTKGLAVLLWD